MRSVQPSPFAVATVQQNRLYAAGSKALLAVTRVSWEICRTIVSNLRMVRRHPCYAAGSANLISWFGVWHLGVNTSKEAQYDSIQIYI